MWSKQEAGDTLDEIVAEFEKLESNLPSRIEKAIRLIQDDYRYLSVNLEFGGQVPTPPQIVARRRYGDCKDLSFLLVNLLRRLGIQARPVLVHAGLRRSIGDVLPTPEVFNHVIVEFEAEGNRRWVDVTMKRQGGGAFHRVVPDFGLGLPVDSAATGLIEPPQTAGQSNLFQLHETVLLDTRGAPSLVALVVRAEGDQAERFRHQFETMGVEEMARQELQNCANRFGRATRIGLLEHRDDRAVNQFFLAQVFEINGFLRQSSRQNQCYFPLPSHWITGVLLKPDKKERRTPFALPFPCQVVHILEVESPAITPDFRSESGSRGALQNPFVQFNRTINFGYGYWMAKFSLNVMADSVPADQIEKHRQFVEDVWKESLLHLYLPLGYARPVQKRGFGVLPDPSVTIIPATKSEPPPIRDGAAHGTENELKDSTVDRHDDNATPQSLPRGTDPFLLQQEHRHWHKPKNRSKTSLLLITIGIAYVVFCLIVLLLRLAHHRPLIER